MLETSDTRLVEYCVTETTEGKHGVRQEVLEMSLEKKFLVDLEPSNHSVLMCVQSIWEYHKYIGGYCELIWGCSVHQGDIIS